MSIQLNEGVHLHVLPTKKYKTIRIMMKFRAPLNKKTITKRAMLANLLETNSKKYPTQTALRSALSNMYGASFGTGVSKKGNTHIFSISLNLVNEKYLSKGDNVLQESIDFLKEIIFQPNTENGHFHEQTFKREKENLVDYYDSLFDDKQTYASLALQELLFEDVNQQIPSVGSKEDLEELTPTSLYDYYQELLDQDKIDIYLMGDVDESEIQSAFEQFNFSSREIAPTSSFYAEMEPNEVENKTEEQDIIQAKFNLGYTTSVFYHEPSYYAAQVFNGLFGGFPHSKLFMNVREKESLAYYASSSLDTFRGMMTVQTGIDNKKVDQVKEIIALQLKEMQAGNFTEEAVSQTKEMLKNQLFQSEDNPGSVIERIYALQLTKGKILTIDEWVKRIEKVTKEEIIEVANQVKLKATFFLTAEAK
ncbi:putative metalloprotease [Carnobacterium sp. 17-4]|uniref:EF-P 5-aminopentanol modification-associated protein YfmF n=1 Tax=Carnobacterium sp. (strain 17-4) TaxID=208596 RepID=UPI00020587DB|nr:pitrilysin family protein [Carnobacterium sp. 17-4]AEB29373.1 putative metalloprotease [Carnobacterium sp. 17-4]